MLTRVRYKGNKRVTFYKINDCWIFVRALRADGVMLQYEFLSPFGISSSEAEASIIGIRLTFSANATPNKYIQMALRAF